MFPHLLKVSTAAHWVREKEESELTMCTDVDRNDMARICEPGSVRLIGRRLLEQYSRLIHTVDHLEGILFIDYLSKLKKTMIIKKLSKQKNRPDRIIV